MRVMELAQMEKAGSIAFQSAYKNPTNTVPVRMKNSSFLRPNTGRSQADTRPVKPKMQLRVIIPLAFHCTAPASSAPV